MIRYTNNTNIPLSLAVWLAYDEYEHNDNPKTISATTLLKPIKEIILSTRVPEGQGILDISSLAQSKMGTAMHDSIESAWKNNYKQSMKDLGYPQKVIEAIRINPDPVEIEKQLEAGENVIPIYLETRNERELNGWTISGEFDFTGDGRVEDFKSTGTFTYIKKSNDEKYKQQLSIYKWINPNIITKENGVIQYYFTDWQATQVNSNNYPPSRTLEYQLPLMSMVETENFIASKLREIERYIDAEEKDIPECTTKDLWRDKPAYKYYKGGVVTSRSTKNFDNALEANTRLIKDGSKGIVVLVNGQVRKCKYCNAFPVCKQKDAYLANGLLKL